MNDDVPVFNNSNYIFITTENNLGGTLVGRFEVLDRDLAEAGEIDFALIGDFSER